MFKGLSKTSKRAAVATLIISTVLLFGSMTAPLMGRLAMSYPEAYLDGSLYLVLTIPSLVAMVVSFSIGPIALKVNLKTLMIITALAAFAYFMIFAFVGGSNFTIILIGAAIVGIAQGAAMVLTSSIFGAYIADPAQRANFVAISGALLNGGAAVVNVIGGIIAAGNNGLNWPYAYYLGLLIIPALIAFIILMPKAPDPIEAEAAAEGVAPPPTGSIPLKAFLVVIMGFIVSLGMFTFLMNVGLYIEVELGVGNAADAGIANSLFTILGVLAGFSFPIIVRFLKNTIALVGYIVAIVGLVVLIVINTNMIGLFIGSAILGFGFNIAMPFVMGQLMAITPPRWIPVIMSVNMGGMNLAMFLVPYVMPILAAPFGGTINAQLMTAVILVAVASGMATWLFILWKNPAPAEAAPEIEQPAAEQPIV